MLNIDVNAKHCAVQTAVTTNHGSRCHLDQDDYCQCNGRRNPSTNNIFLKKNAVSRVERAAADKWWQANALS